MISTTEENYLKAIFKLSEKKEGSVNTNAIAQELNTAAASVTEMIKRMAKKGLIHYESYKGTRLSKKGDKIARNLIRKHRLWECFLYEHLEFSWGEVHDIAEQLEHIKSEELVNRLDSYLDFPRFDPHGDPIPDANGNIQERKQQPLFNLKKGMKGVVTGVKEHTKPFLTYLDQLKITLGSEIEVIEFNKYDDSIKILNNKVEQLITQKVAKNIFIEVINTN